MVKKFAPLIIVLILFIAGIGVWLALQQASLRGLQKYSQSLPPSPQPTSQESGGGGMVPPVPPAPITSEVPVPTTTPVSGRGAGGKKQINPSVQPIPVPAGGPAEGRVVSPHSGTAPTK